MNFKIYFKLILSTFVVCGFLLIGNPGAYATASTIIWGPSTDTEAFKKLHVTSDFYVAAGNDSNHVRPATVTNFGLTAGILPFKAVNGEIGFDHKSGTGVDSQPFYFNAKLAMPENSFSNYFPAIAVGVYDVGTSSKTTDDVAYVRGAKTFSVGKFLLGRFSAGVFMGNKNLLTYNGKKSNSGVLFGWERQLSEISDKWWIGIDYQGSKSAYGSTNIGISYKFSDNVSMIYGYDFYNNHNLVDTFTVQLDIDF